MAKEVSQIEVSKVGLGDHKEFKTPVVHHRLPITYNGWLEM